LMPSLLLLMVGSFHPASSLRPFRPNDLWVPAEPSTPWHHFIPWRPENSNKHTSPIQTSARDVLQPVYNEDGSRRCSPGSPCPLRGGDCHYDEDCAGSLKCGNNNCKLQFGLFSQEHKRWDLHDDCCAYDDNFCNQELLYPKSRRTCCTPSNPCPYGHGECEKDADCEGSLICGDKNCGLFYDDAGPRDDCCVHPNNTLFWPMTRLPLTNHDSKQPEPVYNEDGSRKCSPNSPCPLKAGDCQYDEDCSGSLKCGNNNCKLEFGLFSQEHKRWDLHDDCCAYTNNFCNQELLYPKSRKTCCTPSNPCPHGHGECEKDEDCEGSLICGDKNCGDFFDDAGPRDDCCVNPKLEYVGFWYKGLHHNNATANTGHG